MLRPEICKGCLVKLHHEVEPDMLEQLDADDIVPGVAYRVLAVESGKDDPDENIVWIDTDTFTPQEVDAFDPFTSLDNDPDGLYADVVPVPALFLQLLLN